MISSIMFDRIDVAAHFIAGTDDPDVLMHFYTLCEAAAEYWSGLDPYDFCVQSFKNGEVIVFGSTNRLIWSARGGFRPDVSYCTGQFLINCRRLGSLPLSGSSPY